MPALQFPSAIDRYADDSARAVRQGMSAGAVSVLEQAIEMPLNDTAVATNSSVVDLIESGPESWVNGESKLSRPSQLAIESALWLLAGDLNRSHTISQSLETPLGSFLHGIMHRREGDFGNAKYWFQRASLSEIDEGLARSFPNEYQSARAFVDRVSLQGGGSDHDLRLVQWAEWLGCVGFALQ